MLSDQKNDELTVYIVSDSIGKTAETVVDAVVSQFDSDEVGFKKFINVTSIAKLSEIIARARQENVLIVYTIVLPELCEYLTKMAAKYEIPILDLMGPALLKFSQLLGQQPKLKPGLNHQLDQEYFERIACIEFAIRCDDGKDMKKVKEADIVIVGVSRTSKTPLSMYLAHRGYKAANYPIVPEVDPPPELFEIPSKKMVGLTIDAPVLKEIRQQRLKSMRFNSGAAYAKVDRILDELDYAESLMRKLGCLIINVTNKSIEETASEILAERSEL
ncbi:pyruvate, water dikinase regulatory protein [Fuchsiella alkaliacetigena]|uniref:pyruvate, water dikinase regulatory protein n=1 Tax=Fuchsiella alkaliacetigena TaxID=957042 RepID=UPI00200B5813|nr:pyruvate, water dikinase regulatory protein [Fuchsiella alkaliacetigena]MCK8824478.1 kinase/pyrophosphorylase [Fuchsiella alkaliacetigena]